MSYKPKNPDVVQQRQVRRIIRQAHEEPNTTPPPPRHGHVGPRKTFVHPHHRS